MLEIEEIACSYGKIEALRKALKWDAYFLDQEKKWLEEERNKLQAF